MNIARKARSPLHSRLHQLQQNWNSTSIRDNNPPQPAAKTSSRSQDLARILVASKSGGYACPFPGCYKTFRGRDGVLRHFESHVSDVQFGCSYCDKFYNSPTQRRDHVSKSHPEKFNVFRIMDSQNPMVKHVKEMTMTQMEKCAMNYLKNQDGDNQGTQDDDDYGGPPELVPEVPSPPPPLQGQQNDCSGESQLRQAAQPSNSLSTGPSLQNIKAFYASKRLKLNKGPPRYAPTEQHAVKQRNQRITKLRNPKKNYQRRQKRAIPADCELCQNKHYSCQSSYVRHSRGLHWKWLPFRGLQCEFCDGKLLEDILTRSDAELHYMKHSRQLRTEGTMFFDGYGKQRPDAVHSVQQNEHHAPNLRQMIGQNVSGQSSDNSTFVSKRSAHKDQIRTLNRDYLKSRNQECSWCPKSFDLFSDLQMHVEDHHKNFQVVFRTVNQHQLEKLYSCFCCLNRYQLLIDLQQHLKHDHPEQWGTVRYYSLQKLREMSLQKERLESSVQDMPPSQSQQCRSTDVKPINRQLFGRGSRSDKIPQSTLDTRIYLDSAQNTSTSPASPEDRPSSAFPPYGLLTPMSLDSGSSNNFPRSPANISGGISRLGIETHSLNSFLLQDENVTPIEVPIICNDDAIKNTATVVPSGQYSLPIVKIEPPDVIEILSTTSEHPVHRFLCPYKRCGSSFSTEEKLETHKRKHNMVRKIVCKRCHKTVYTRGDGKCCSPCVTAMEALSEAYKPKSWVMPTIKCFDCSASFDSESSILSHLKAEHMDPQNSKPRECPVCSFTLENAREFYSHIRAHAFDRDRPLSCKDPTRSCQQQFENEEDLSKHLKAAHPELDPAKLGFAAEAPPHIDQQKPKIHREYDKEPIKPAPKLGFFKPRRKLFKTKPIPIPASAAAAAFLPVLAVSAKQNANERVFPYPKNMCYICFCCFVDETVLANHVAYAHGRTPATYNCNDCNFSTRNALSYQKHNVDHEKEYPHCCPEPKCFKKCRTLNELNNHKTDYHTGRSMKSSNGLLATHGFDSQKVMLKSSDAHK